MLQQLISNGKLVLSSHLLCFSFCILFFSHPLSHLLHRPIRTFSISKSIFQTLQLPFISMFFIIHRERLREMRSSSSGESREQSLHLQEPAASACKHLYHSKPWIRYDISHSHALCLAPFFSLALFWKMKGRWIVHIAFTKCSWSIWCSSITLGVPNSSSTHTHTHTLEYSLGNFQCQTGL